MQGDGLRIGHPQHGDHLALAVYLAVQAQAPPAEDDDQQQGQGEPGGGQLPVRAEQRSEPALAGGGRDDGSRGRAAARQRPAPGGRLHPLEQARQQIGRRGHLGHGVGQLLDHAFVVGQ